LSASKKWPLKRPITTKEWNQIIKALIVRRVPTRLPIPREILVGFVRDDLRAAISKVHLDGHRGPLYVYGDREYIDMKIVDLVQDKRLAFKIMDLDEKGEAVMGVYCTDRTQEIIDYLPKSLQAVLDYLPVTNLVSWLAYEVADGEESETPPLGHGE